jgi:hypothetical protein
VAIYVYYTSNGALYSWCPNDTDQVAPPSVLAGQGMASKSGLPPLDKTHAWDPGTQTVIVVTAPTPIAFLNSFAFILRFTHAEWHTFVTSRTSDNYCAHFLDSLVGSNQVNLNDPTIQDFVGTYSVSKTWLTAARATAILDTTGLTVGQ